MSKSYWFKPPIPIYVILKSGLNMLGAEPDYPLIIMPFVPVIFTWVSSVKRPDWLRFLDFAF